MIHDLPHDFLHSINPTFFLLEMQIPGCIQLLSDSAEQPA
jgi:hypothetical protein